MFYGSPVDARWRVTRPVPTGLFFWGVGVLVVICKGTGSIPVRSASLIGKLA